MDKVELSRNVTALVFEPNRDFGLGGGIYNQGTLILINSTVSENTAQVGGGIWNDPGGIITLTDSTISGNLADIGGGLFDNGGLFGQNLGRITLLKSIISGNRADQAVFGLSPCSNGFLDICGRGGGIYANHASNLTLINSTVSGNTDSPVVHCPSCGTGG